MPRLSNSMISWAGRATLVCAFLLADNAIAAQLEILPAKLELTAQDRVHGMLVTLIGNDGRQEDVTAHATFRSSDPAIATVDAKGLCHLHGDGSAQIAVRFGDQSAEIAVTASGSAQPAA